MDAYPGSGFWPAPKTGLKKSRTKCTPQRTWSEYASDGPISPGRRLKRSNGMPWRFSLSYTPKPAKSSALSSLAAPRLGILCTRPVAPNSSRRTQTAACLLAGARHLSRFVWASLPGVAVADNMGRVVHAS